MKVTPIVGVQETPLKLIESFVESVRCQSYLELGILSGQTLSCISNVVPRCVGVDKRIHRDFEPQKETTVVRTMTTDEFFSTNRETFDVIYIDASHVVDQVIKDFENSVKALNPSGFILLHDTDPAKKEFLEPDFCYNVYQIVEYIREIGEYDIITLPTSAAGLSIVSRKNNRRVLKFL